MVKARWADSCHCAAEASGYIRVQDGLFVDEECKEFMFSGYNDWDVGPFCMPAVCSRQCSPLEEKGHAASRCQYGCGLLTSILHAQTIEAALNLCCGNLVALQSQFQEAGMATARVAPAMRRLNLHVSVLDLTSINLISAAWATLVLRTSLLMCR